MRTLTLKTTPSDRHRRQAHGDQGLFTHSTSAPTREDPMKERTARSPHACHCRVHYPIHHSGRSRCQQSRSQSTLMNSSHRHQNCPRSAANARRVGARRRTRRSQNTPPCGCAVSGVSSHARSALSWRPSFGRIEMCQRFCQVTHLPCFLASRASMPK